LCVKKKIEKEKAVYEDCFFDVDAYFAAAAAASAFVRGT
jgi:hypothetical protein